MCYHLKLHDKNNAIVFFISPLNILLIKANKKTNLSTPYTHPIEILSNKATVINGNEPA